MSRFNIDAWEDRRKHHTQMSDEEQQALTQAVRVRIPKIGFGPHAKDRMQQKRISRDEVVRALAYGKVIEAHNNNPRELRVLVRGKVKGKAVCAVVSLTTDQVVTTYRNEWADNHKEANVDAAYTWKADLVTVLAQGLNSEGLR
jgi:hypothetical protein